MTVKLRASPARSNSQAIAIAAIGTIIGSALVVGRQAGRFDERVHVHRVIVDVRVLDDAGSPVLGLTATDFSVRIDGKPARIDTAAWIGERLSAPAAAEGPPDAAHDAGSTGTEPALGRLVVFLFQKDLDRGRIEGLMQLLLRSRDFLASLTAADRVAILSFDSHLKIWTDFTNDRERLDRILGHALLFETPAAQSSSPPSLLDHLSTERARRTYGIERALQLIGEALEPMPGSKSLVLIGHGFGRLGLAGVRMENDYEPARRALVAARTSVFSLDVTDADYHSLEAGLQLVSEQTGGFYARTHIFPAQAMRRLSGALAGYYVLFVEKPESRRVDHSVSVKLTRRNGRVLATSRYTTRGG